MSASRRLTKELSDLQSSKPKLLHDLKISDENILSWNATLLPDKAPYCKGAFRIQLNFPAEYPFKPPKIIFKTKIYHPNVDEKGQICLPIIEAENWKPAVRAHQVVESLISLIYTPEPDHPLRTDVAEEFYKDRKKFLRNAEEHTRKFSEKRSL